MSTPKPIYVRIAWSGKPTDMDIIGCQGMFIESVDIVKRPEVITRRERALEAGFRRYRDLYRIECNNRDDLRARVAKLEKTNRILMDRISDATSHLLEK